MSTKDIKRDDAVSVEGDSRDSLNMGLNFYLIMTAVVAAISGFNVGLNSSVVNIPGDTIRKCKGSAGLTNDSAFPLCMLADDLTWGLVIGLAALGGGVGSLLASRILETLGRRKTLMANNLLFIIGGLLIATTTEYGQMGVGRFIIGAASGLATVSVSTYVGEISPAKGRGAMGTVLQFMLVVGILVGQIISYFLDAPTLWRWLFAITVFPSTVQFFMLYFCVESPRYLISRNRIEPARTALAKLRSGYSIENEFNAIVEGQKDSAGQDNVMELGVAEEKQVGFLDAFKELFRDPVQFKYLMIALVLHCTQQLSGINGVIFYSNSIFETTFAENATFATIGVGALNLAITIVSVFIVDRLGRKVLLLASLFGMTIMSVVIVIGSVYDKGPVVVAGVMLFVATFAIGLGSIPWLIMPELFPTRTVAAASALCMGMNWFANFAVSLLFPYVLALTKQFTFVIFAAITLGGGLFVLTFLPETKGRTLEEILASARRG